MKYIIEYLPSVERDVQDTYDWYKEQHIGLGEDFLLSSDATISSIQRNPLVYQVAFKGVRRAKTKRFPFGVFYIVDSNIITVIAIIHLSRHPRTWRKRISRKRK